MNNRRYRVGEMDRRRYQVREIDRCCQARETDRRHRAGRARMADYYRRMAVDWVSGVYRIDLLLRRPGL